MRSSSLARSNRTSGSGCFHSLLLIGVRVVTLSFLFGYVLASANLTLPANAPEVTYSPFVCGPNSASCSGAWTATNLSDGGALVSTTGPAKGSTTIPQVFLTFQASSLYIHTSAASTAVANITISSFALDETISSRVNTSIGLIAIVGLPASEVISLSITYDSPSPAVLGIESFELVIPDDCASCTSIFPTSVPPTQTSTPPAYSTPSGMTLSFPSTTAMALSVAQKKQHTALVVGETFSALFGSLLVIGALLFFWFWRRTRRRQRQQAQYHAGASSAATASLAQAAATDAKDEDQDRAAKEWQNLCAWFWRWRTGGTKTKDAELGEGGANPEMLQIDPEASDASPTYSMPPGAGGGGGPIYLHQVGAPIRMRGGSASISISVSDVGTRAGAWSTMAVEAGGDNSSRSAIGTGVGVRAAAPAWSTMAVEAGGDNSSRSVVGGGICTRGAAWSTMAVEAGGDSSRSAIGTGVGIPVTRASSTMAVEAGGDNRSAIGTGVGVPVTRASSTMAVEAGGDNSSRSAIGSGVGIAVTRGSSIVAVESGGDEPTSKSASASLSAVGAGIARTRASSMVAVEAGGDES